MWFFRSFVVYLVDGFVFCCLVSFILDVLVLYRVLLLCRYIFDFFFWVFFRASGVCLVFWVRWLCASPGAV